MPGIGRKLSLSKEQVKEAYANGATLREIADVHNVSSGTVRNCLIEQGVELRTRGRRKKQNANQSRALPMDNVTPPATTYEAPTPVVRPVVNLGEAN